MHLEAFWEADFSLQVCSGAVTLWITKPYKSRGGWQRAAAAQNQSYTVLVDCSVAQ